MDCHEIFRPPPLPKNGSEIIFSTTKFNVNGPLKVLFLLELIHAFQYWDPLLSTAHGILDLRIVDMQLVQIVGFLLC